jgi:hypothetical protein
MSDKLTIPAMIFILILVFLVVVYYVGSTSAFKAFAGGVTTETQALQGAPGGKIINYPTGG